MMITRELLISGNPQITYGPGHPKRPYNYDVDRVIGNTLWIWDQIKSGFDPCDWTVIDMSPGFKVGSPILLKSLPDLINRISGAINSKAYRKGWKTDVYAALEHIDESSYGDHFHCLVRIPGGLTKRQERTLKYQVKSMRIFKDVSRPVNIRPLCPSGSFLDVIRTLHYFSKQTNRTYDPYNHYKTK